VDRLRRFIHKLSLSQQFMLASLVILFAGMVGIGIWVERQIETGVIHRTGATAALYVDSFVSPYLQVLGESDQLQPEQIEQLSELLQNTPIGQQIVAFKVWDTRGRLLFSTDASTIGRIYPMHEGLLRARLGQVVSEISPLTDEENAPLGRVHDQLLETYSPVWLSGTSQVIAVAEFYQSTEELDREIGILRSQSWLVVGFAILLMYLLLSGFVRNASETITQQSSELSRRVDQLTELLAQNLELHERVRQAAGSVALLNESYLRRVGSELHDGPAQDLGLSLLKLDAIIEWIEAHPQESVTPEKLVELGGIQSSLQNALKEMRGVAAGLSLPQLAELSLPETVVRVVRAHERQTGTGVTLELGQVPDQIGMPLKITVYRLIQEALNNAYRHANGAGQQVKVHCEKDQMVVEVSDRGPGFQLKQGGEWDGRLGLSGMRERVESLGGRFRIESEIGRGTRVQAYLPCQLEGEGWE
jgi:signal transduction histidine kinase